MSNKNDQLYKIRHSSEHVLMIAMGNLGYKFHMAMGPATDDGFYFDFELLEGTITEENFSKIEKEMVKVIKSNQTFIQKDVKEKEARELFKGNPYKQEWVDEITKRGEKIGTYTTGDFVDICAGPHVKSTKEIGAVKLLSIAGAYWRGSEKNKMLTRVYGTAFATQKELDEYLVLLEEAKLRDHKKIGAKQELFMFHETSPGMPYWLPKGLIVYNELVDYWRKEHRKHNYQEIVSPLLNKKELYETSGHWEHYKDDMFIADMGENEVYGVKPMNCPNAMIVFGSKTRSYKDLPLRLSDTDRLHRYERSGTLNGLLRIRSFQQDDSHNYITEEMIESEYLHIFDLCKDFYAIFGLEYTFRLGTRPEVFMGEIETWDKAEATLKKVLENSGKQYFIKDGDGAFYGPKVDILMNDALGREWQMGTIQLDFQQPDRFKLKYVDEEGKEKTPVAIHRVIYGSLERFLGILIEHTSGAFPVWLHPVQVQIIPISEKHVEYANKIAEALNNANIRYEIDNKDETMGNKIRKAQELKVPFMIIVGDKEVEADTISVRYRDGEQENGLKLDKFVNQVETVINSKSLNLKN